MVVKIHLKYDVIKLSKLSSVTIHLLITTLFFTSPRHACMLTFTIRHNLVWRYRQKFLRNSNLNEIKSDIIHAIYLTCSCMYAWIVDASVRRHMHVCLCYPSPRFLCRPMAFCSTCWSLGMSDALSIRKTADLPLHLRVGTFPRFVAIGFYFLSETLI